MNPSHKNNELLIEAQNFLASKLNINDFQRCKKTLSISVSEVGHITRYSIVCSPSNVFNYSLFIMKQVYFIGDCVPNSTWSTSLFSNEIKFEKMLGNNYNMFSIDMTDHLNKIVSLKKSSQKI